MSEGLPGEDCRAVDAGGAKGEGIRAKLKYLVAPLTFRIREGPLKGARWSPASGVRFIRGDFKAEKSQAMDRLLKPGHVVYDVGAHVGYTTVLASRRVGSGGHVVAFEPRGINLRFLRVHLKANGVENVRVVTSAVGRETGRASFDARRGSGTGRLSASGAATVPVLALDDLLAVEDLRPPDFIKVDVEGGEVGVLEGGMEFLRRHEPRLFLATHGPEVEARCLEILRELGYGWEVLSRGRAPGEAELLCSPGGPESSTS